MFIPIRETLLEKTNLPSDDVVLRQRAGYLAPEDRDLFISVVIDGVPATMLASWMDLDARQIRRRVHSLGRHLASRKFLAVLRSLEFLNRDEQRLAKRHVLQRVPIGQLRREFRLSKGALYRRLHGLKAKINLLERARRTERRRNRVWRERVS